MAVIVAVIVYIANRLTLDWKSEHQLCTEKYQVVDVQPGA